MGCVETSLIPVVCNYVESETRLLEIKWPSYAVIDNEKFIVFLNWLFVYDAPSFCFVRK